MPAFRISGDVRYAFVHEVPDGVCKTLAEAEALVKDIAPEDLDDVCTNSGGRMIEIHAGEAIDEMGTSATRRRS